MNENEFDRTVRAWLEEGPSHMSDRVLSASLAQIHVTRQRRAPWPTWRIPMNNALRIASAAAAVLVVAVVGVRLVMPGTGVGGPQPVATPSLETPSPTPAPTLAAALLSVQSGELAPGPYAITDLSPFLITITVSEGWEKLTADATVWSGGSAARLGFRTVDNLYADPCAPGRGGRDPAVGPTVDDLASALQEASAWQASAPTDVTLAGYAGTQMELTAPPASDACPGGDPPPSLWQSRPQSGPGPSLGERIRLWILDVEGDRLVVLAGDGQEATEEVVAELDAIIDSIRIYPR